MVKKNDYAKFFKKEVQTRFKTILKILNEQDSDSAIYGNLKKRSNELAKEFQVKLTKEESISKFKEILELMKTIHKQLYSFEKVNTIIIEYCDMVNNLLGKKTLFFKMAIPEKIREEYNKKEKNKGKFQKKKKEIPETIELVVKAKKQRYVLKIAAMIIIILMTIPFFISSGETRAFEVHIFPRTVNMTVNMTEDTNLAKYQNATMYDGASLNIKGKIQYISELNKYDVQTHNIYLIDNESNKILLKWLNREDLTMLTRDGITEDYFLVSGDYDFIEYNTGIEGPLLYVNNIEKTTLETWQEQVSKRLPAEDIIEERALSIGMRSVYKFIDMYRDKVDIKALIKEQKK